MSKERGLKRQHISHATIKLIGCKRFNLSIVLGFSHLCSRFSFCKKVDEMTVSQQSAPVVLSPDTEAMMAAFHQGGRWRIIAGVVGYEPFVSSMGLRLTAW